MSPEFPSNGRLSPSSGLSHRVLSTRGYLRFSCEWFRASAVQSHEIPASRRIFGIVLAAQAEQDEVPGGRQRLFFLFGNALALGGASFFCFGSWLGGGLESSSLHRDGPMRGAPAPEPELWIRLHQTSMGGPWRMSGQFVPFFSLFRGPRGQPPALLQTTSGNHQWTRDGQTPRSQTNAGVWARALQTLSVGAGEAVLSESLRLYPSVPIDGKMVLEDRAGGCRKN